MAKKKQLAGKQTKLAKLPLTQVLARQAEQSASPGLPPNPAGVGPELASLSFKKAGEGSAGHLAAAYFHVVQELAALRSQLQPAMVAPPEKAVPPPDLPDFHQLNLVLKQARQGLKDLYRILSQE